MKFEESKKLLETVLDTLSANYGLKFIIEEVEFSNCQIYRIKERKEIDLIFRKKILDEYLTTFHGNVMNFNSLEDVSIYLTLRYSEPEGLKVKCKKLVFS
jgi:hypothetical protein